MSTKQVIVLRKDLNMRKGKMVAQGAHASMGALLSRATYQGASCDISMTDAMRQWLEGSFTKICVSVSSEQELLDLHQRCLAEGVVCCLIKDNGRTEFGGVPTYTALAVGPDLCDRIDLLTGHLPLL